MKTATVPSPSTIALVRQVIVRSAVRLTLTHDGARRLEALSELHLDEVPRLASTMRTLFADLDQTDPGQPTGAGAPSRGLRT